VLIVYHGKWFLLLKKINFHYYFTWPG